jgi:hypothetical protein
MRTAIQFSEKGGLVLEEEHSFAPLGLDFLGLCTPG